MKRDPKQTCIDNYLNSIQIKKIYPLFFWEKCKKCGMEYRREPMYECISEIHPNADMLWTHIGCTHCFNSKDNFKKFLQENDILLSEKELKRIYERKNQEGFNKFYGF